VSTRRETRIETASAHLAWPNYSNHPSNRSGIC